MSIRVYVTAWTIKGLGMCIRVYVTAWAIKGLGMCIRVYVTAWAIKGLGMCIRVYVTAWAIKGLGMCIRVYVTAWKIKGLGMCIRVYVTGHSVQTHQVLHIQSHYILHPIFFQFAENSLPSNASVPKRINERVQFVWALICSNTRNPPISSQSVRRPPLLCCRFHSTLHT